MASSILRSIFCGMRMSGNTWPAPPSPPKLSPPFLILPSPYEVGYKELYSLTEKKVVSIDKAAPPPAWAQGRRVKHMGCSHGWVASFNYDNRKTFLFDPITGCHIELPDIDDATEPCQYIILTSSPDSPACRAIMHYQPSYRLAACFPAHGRGGSWLSVGGGQGHYTVVCYSTRHNHLFCLFAKSVMVWTLECWDLEYPSSLLWNAQVCFQQDEAGSWTHTCLNYLVIDEHSDRLFLVIRFMLDLEPDDFDDDDDDDDDDDEEDDVDEEKEDEEWRSYLRRFYHKTLRFRVYEINREKGGEMRYMDGSLDGLAMFVGSNHAFALPAADFNLNPDSIYFNEDGVSYIAEDGRNDDIGIYNYVNGKICSIDYYPTQKPTYSSSRIAPAMWLTPIPHYH
ncbi:uncharacterized protein LOC121788687 [Salvia splendens]|uniref:uncharacterized protein LOC121788687 n=1 Tax=Salvia splendens TaxID=180675 RepID=UPI001C261F3B|nr:uncharacterized protein LOC121788687 [Salvia splendens]